ncbi:MAG: dihydroorotase [Bacteroidota bacterium]
MMKLLIKNGTIVNEGVAFEADILCVDGIIAKIKSGINDIADTVIDAKGKYVIPGAIDDQVHFREPGLTHKAEIFTEAKAAVAGGITSFMEMPNTVPNTLTQELLEEKYKRAAEVSLANYSFFMGASNNNLDEVLKTDGRYVCGIKVFMGSSTGNMLVDNRDTLENLFKNCHLLIATHCEDEATVRKNSALFKEKYGDQLNISHHPLIRNEEACYLSSSMAVELAKKYGTRLHILHISTAKEVSLFDNITPLEKKKITAEACIHHLWFSDEDYAEKGNYIKWNPAVKTKNDRAEVFKAVFDNHIDIIATDHAPHTIEEKNKPYAEAPSGGPLVQHAVVAMMEFVKQGKITIEQMVNKMCHSPAVCFQIEKRGFIREGYFADIVVIDPHQNQTVSKENILYKCGWSPFEGTTFHSQITQTIVSGHLVYNNGHFDQHKCGMRLTFER